MTHSQEREQRKLAYYAEPQNGALKRNGHILGISGDKDSAPLFMGNPSMIFRRPFGGIPSSILLRELFDPSFCRLHFSNN